MYVGKVCSFDLSIEPVGECQCVLYRVSHIWLPELCFDAAVAELHHRVNYRLRVNDNLYFVCRNIEEPTCLYHLEPFVHHRCRVDSDFCPHLPSRVSQGVVSCGKPQIVFRSISERSARGCEDKFLDTVLVFTHEALEYCTMLRVYGDNVYAVSKSEVCNEFSGYHECFFICQSYFFTCLDSPDRRQQTRISHHSRNNRIDGRHSGYLTDTVGSRKDLYGQPVESLPQCFIMTLVGNSHHFWAISLCLLYQ